MKPVTISDELAAKYTDPGQFEKFDATVRKLLSVSREEIKSREAEYKKQAAQKLNRRGPKPKPKSSDAGLDASLLSLESFLRPLLLLTDELRIRQALVNDFAQVRVGCVFPFASYLWACVTAPL